jgi:hypothetical protein
MPNALEGIKRNMLPILNSHRVKRAAVFGSVARGDAKKGSDIDILVELDSKAGFFGFISLKHDLERKLGKKVDLVEYGAIDPYLKRSILNQQVRII